MKKVLIVMVSALICIPSLVAMNIESEKEIAKNVPTEIIAKREIATQTVTPTTAKPTCLTAEDMKTIYALATRLFPLNGHEAD